MASLIINGQFHSDVQIKDIQSPWPCTWRDTDTVYVFYDHLWWKASASSVALGDRKGQLICYWDRINPRLIPAELRVYQLILN